MIKISVGKARLGAAICLKSLRPITTICQHNERQYKNCNFIFLLSQEKILKKIVQARQGQNELTFL
jgi:hypothetical protein